MILDGKESIEHQLEIHVTDLLQTSQTDRITLHDILAGLRYVMDYRIKGGKQPNLDESICTRLVSALLNVTSQQKGGFITRKLTKESHLAFALFGDFLEQVEEIKKAVGNVPLGDLKHRLKFHLRIGEDLDQERSRVGLAVLKMLTAWCPHCTDWKDLVYEGYHSQIKKMMDCGDTKMPLVGMKLAPPPALYFDKKPEKVVEMFKSDSENGLSKAQIELWRAEYGRNLLPKAEKPKWWKMLFRQIADFMNIILIIASIYEGFTEEFASMGILLAVVVINVLIGFIQEVKAGKALEALLSFNVPTARVIREGSQEIIPSEELVPGDIVVLEEGDAIPADVRFLFVGNCQVNETILTGESVPVTKSINVIKAKTRNLPLCECKGNGFMTTTLARGTARAIVVRIGSKTAIGKISAVMTATPDVQTPIQKKLDLLGKILVVVAFLLCGLSLLLTLTVAQNKPALKKAIETAIALAVSVIPEGLVAVVSVTMALAVKRMAARNVIVRKLPSVETLGSVTVICSDKTGTLTQGKMAPRVAWTSEQTLNFESNDPQVNSYSMEMLMMCSVVCNNASVTAEKELGDATEIALLKAGIACGYSKPQNMVLLKEYAFDSERKCMSCVVKKDQELLVLTKGAPEAVMNACTSILLANKEIKSISDASDWTDSLHNQHSLMASNGLRVLALAFKSINVMEEEVEKDLTFVGLVGLIDPPRESVKKSIAECKSAGIKVCMITGDHIQTAIAIATDLGIYDNSSRAIRGRELDTLNEQGIASLEPFPCVFARVSPENKLDIVRALQSKGHYVAMTGDGVNDAPAIKKADVGIAMGLTGTEITKQAADIVLSNDDFSSIVVAVKEGRRIFDNINKFIIYLLSCNSSEIFVFLFSPLLFSGTNPFTVKNILFANIIADIPPSMSIGLEPEESNIMLRPPRDPKLGILTKWPIFVILSQGFVMALLTLLVFYIPIDCDSHLYPNCSRTETFATLTCIQLILAFLSRSVSLSVFQTGIRSNPTMIISVLLSFVCLLAANYIPILAELFDLGPMGWKSWVKVLMAVVVMFIYSEIIKLVYRSNLKETSEHTNGSNAYLNV